MLRALSLGLSLAAVAGSALATPIVIPAYRMPVPPVIDGVIHEGSEWKDVPSVSGLYDDLTGTRAKDGGTVWLAYDERYVYVAARMADSQPSQISARQYQTNVGMQGDDYVEVGLDVSGTGRDFSTFEVNPKGATNILLAGGRAPKREWRGEFKAKSRITSAGWETEIQIPWKLKQLPAAGKRDLRFNLTRIVARSGRVYGLAFLTRGSVVNMPVWKGVSVPLSPLDRSIKLLPYVYAGYDPSAPWIMNSGLDLKTSLFRQVQLVGSINPDFRNVENQILSLDFTRFARLAGETRPFFLEGSNYISSPLFASQLIPRFDAGVSSYGKLNDKVSFGLLDAQRVGRENDLVVTASDQIDATSSFRAGATNLDRAQHHNDAYFARYAKGSGPWLVSIGDSESQDTDHGHGDNASARALYSSAGLTGLVSVARVTPNFDPGLGFFPEVDYRGYRSFITYDRPAEHGIWSQAGVGAGYLVYQHADGSDYRRDANASAFGELRNGLDVYFNEDEAQFAGSNDHLASVGVSYPATNPYNNISTSYNWGREQGIYYSSASLSASLHPLSRLQVSASYQAVDYSGFNDQAILNLNWDMRRDSSIYGRLVKQGSDINGYLAFRRSGNLGAEYYLIIGDPNAPRFRPSVILKVVIPLKLGG